MSAKSNLPKSIDANRPTGLVAEILALFTGPNTASETVRTGACRYCWGTDYAWQWKSKREYQAALVCGDLDDPDLSDRGGYGFREDRAPNPDCPECGGVGADKMLGQLFRMLPAGTLVRAKSVELSGHRVRITLHSPFKLLCMLLEPGPREALVRFAELQKAALTSREVGMSDGSEGRMSGIFGQKESGDASLFSIPETVHNTIGGVIRGRGDDE